jgi:replicative DNA helicase
LEQLDAEVAVLGACIMDPGGIGEIADFLVRADFGNEPHREIYSAMLDLWKAGEPVSDATLCARLREHKKLSLAGGASYISGLTLEMPDVANIDFYSKEVKASSLTRKLQMIGTKLKNVDGNPHEALNAAMEKMVEAGADSLKSIPLSLGLFTTMVADESIAISEGTMTRDVIKMGAEGESTMPIFDEVTDGLSPSDLLIIAAEPSVGKSAFALWIAKLVAEQNYPVLFVSLEMSGKQIGTRLLAAETGIKYTSIQDGNLQDMDRVDIRDANKKLSMLPFTIDDRAGQTIGDIRTKARREQVRTGLSLMVLDYLQIATPTPDDVGEVARISTGLKSIAKDLEIPVIALSQMSRNIQHRDSKEPVLADLKQSSQIEQDADLVAFLYHRDKRQLNDLTFIVKKHRNGSLGEVDLYFEKDNQRFHETGGKRF